MATKIVFAADVLKLATTNDKLETMIDTANKQIFEDVFPKLNKLDKGPVLTGQASYTWDAQALSEEQTLVQPLYEKHKGTDAMKIYEAAVRQEGTYLPDNYNFDRLGGAFLGMRPFQEENLFEPSHRWSYAMKEMGYPNHKSKPTKMPIPK